MRDNMRTGGTITSRGATVLRTFTILFAVSLLVMLGACSSSNNNHTTTPPTVSLSTFPTSLYVNDTAPITATVTNDSTNAGVTWSCTPSGSCGTFSASSSASGTPVTYTAPGNVPSSTVVITATSKADTSVSKSTPAVTINPASGITVTLSGAPASIPTGLTASITATVANDSANGGVNWSCAPAGSCGSFSANSSSSGTAVTYTAPTSPGSVTVTATSVTDNAQNASANMTITSTVATSLAAGNYVFYVSGWDANTTQNGPYSYAGGFKVDSTGAITGGEQDYSDDFYFSTPHEAITGGSVTATADGNLLITLTFNDTNFGNPAGQVTLDASLVSTSKALLTEYDGWASGSGELDLQSTTLATPTGGYAFYMNGADINFSPISLGGVVNVDNAGGAGTISGTGSVMDINDTGSTPTTLYPTQALAANASSVTSPDSFGYVRFELNADCTQATIDQSLCEPIGNGIDASLVTDGYMVDNNHIRLVENYYNDSLSASIGGTALAQGSNTGTFSASTIAGTSYVIGSNGYDTNGALQVAGVLTFNADGSVSGNLSFNDIAAQTAQGGVALEAESTTTPCSSGTATTACYTVDGPSSGVLDAGTGRVTITNVTDGVTFDYNLELYLTGDGHAVLISMDTADEVSGSGWQQTSSTLNAASLTGAYGLGMTQFVPVTGGEAEQDAVGGFNSDGVSAIAGFLDYNGLFTQGVLAPDVAFHAAYATTSTNGVFTVTGGGSSGQMFTSYLVDGTKGVVIENDNSQLSLGYFEQQ